MSSVELSRVPVGAPYLVCPSASGWLVQCEAAGWMGLYGRDLRLRSELPIPSEPSGTHAISSDGQLAALSLEGRVVLVDPSGDEAWVTPVALGEQQMGSCWFLRGDSVVSALVPGEDMDVLALIDTATGEVIDQQEIDTFSEGSFQFDHAESGWHGLTVSYGQNGSVSRWVDTRAQLDVLTAFDDARSLVGGNSPDGSHYITYPHPEGDELAVRAFPSGAVERSTKASTTFSGERVAVQNAVYLDNDTVLVAPDKGFPALVSSGDLRSIGSVGYPSANERFVCGPQQPDETWTTNCPRTRTLEQWTIAH
jgi:hypothetical protein